MRFTSPPRSSMLRVWVAWTTAPAPRNSSALNTAWLTVWYSPATNASAASSGWPVCRNMSAAPRPIRMIPMFSML